jgi:hypothetical protein
MSKGNGGSAGGGGIGVLGLLGVVFVTLKLCGVIDWSWWFVTAPFWGPLAFVAAVALPILLLAGIVYLAKRD